MGAFFHFGSPADYFTADGDLSAALAVIGEDGVGYQDRGLAIATRCRV